MSRTRTASRGILPFFASLALAGVLLSGCTVATTELTAETATQLQNGVVAVAETAAGGDAAAALVRLDELQAALAAALADGGVSDERAAEIQVAIDAVRGDLTQLAAPDPEPVTPVEPVVPAQDGGGDDDDSGSGNEGNGNEGNGNEGNGNDGNGGGKGKGKGNG